MTGALAFSGAVFSQAHAAGSVLTPDSGWAVSKITAADTGGAAYCALARRFDSGVILTMARNINDEASIAIDFQKETLNKTQTYNLKLRPGPGQERSFDVRPVSGRAVVVRLGQDYAFYDAINRSSRLDVSMAGQTYSFSITDFPQGQNRLNGCLATLVEPAAGGGGESMAAVPVPAPVSESVPLSAPSSSPVPLAAVDRSAEVQALREENDRLSAALSRERRTYEDKLMQQSAGSSKASELAEKISLLERENEDLRGKLSVAAARPEPPPPQVCPVADTSAVDSMAEEINSLRGENVRLKADLETQRAAVASLSSKAATGTADATALKSQLDSLSSEKEVLRGESERLKAELETQKQLVQKLTRDVGANAGAAESRVAEADAKLAEAGRKLAEAESKLAEVVAQKSRIDARLADADKRDTDAAIKMSKAETMLAEAEAKLVEASRRAVERPAPRNDESLAAIGRLEARVESLQIENETLRRSLDEARSSVSSPVAEASAGVPLSELHEVEARLASAEAERDRLARELDSFSSKKEDGLLSISSSNWNLEQATRRYNEAEREIRRLGMQLEKQRTQCAAEKKQIEYMLFDPKIAEEQQISKLTTLEMEVDKAKDDLQVQRAAYEEKIAALEGRLASVGASPVVAAAADRGESFPAARPAGGESLSEDVMLSEIRDAMKDIERIRQTEVEAPSALPSVAPVPVAQVPLESIPLESTPLESASRDPVTEVVAAVEPVPHETVRPQPREMRSAMDLEASEKSFVTASLPEPVESAPVAPVSLASVPVSDPAADPAAASAISPAAGGAPASAVVMDENGIRSFLSASRIPFKGDVARVSTAGPGVTAHTWKTDTLFGSFEQRALGPDDVFGDLVSSYIEKTKGRCTGDFAAVPGLDQTGSSGVRVAAYEIACIGESASASAALVFFSRDGVFTTMANEAAVENMDQAMDARDGVISYLMQEKISSN